MSEELLTFYRERSDAQMTQVSVRITDEQERFLAKLAAKIGVKKADLFRMALQHWLSEGPHAKLVDDVIKKGKS